MSFISFLYRKSRQRRVHLWKSCWSSVFLYHNIASHWTWKMWLCESICLAMVMCSSIINVHDTLNSHIHLFLLGKVSWLKGKAVRSLWGFHHETWVRSLRIVMQVARHPKTLVMQRGSSSLMAKNSVCRQPSDLLVTYLPPYLSLESYHLT